MVTLHHQTTPENAAIVGACPSLRGQYRPPRWASGPHTQIGLFLLKEALAPRITWDKTELLVMEDGGTVSIEWHGLGAASPHSPTLVVLPTITGSGEALRHFVVEMNRALGWPVAVCNRRGHAALPLTAPLVNTMGHTGDLACQLDAIEAARPDSPLYAAGLSAGSGLLVRYLGEQGARTPLRAGVVYCPAYDISVAFERAHPFYSAVLARRLRDFFLRPHEPVLGHIEGFEACAASRDLQTFHDRLYPMAGYPSREAFYEGANPMVVARQMSVPTLVINAEDDPVCTISNVRRDGLPLIDALPNCILALTERGSHCAFYEAPWGRTSWANQAMAEYLKATHALLTRS